MTKYNTEPCKKMSNCFTCLNEVSEVSVSGFPVFHCYVHPLFDISTLMLSEDAEQWSQLQPPLILWDTVPTTYSSNVSCNHPNKQ